MSQAELFDPAPAGLVLVRGGWITNAGAPALGSRVWTHPSLPGVAVRHCGHPTALRPYYLTGLPIARKFPNLAGAQAAAFNPEPFIKETLEHERNH